MVIRTFALFLGLGLGSAWTQQPTFLEASGQVSLEAESGTILNRSQFWFGRGSTPGFSGSEYLSAEPNSGANLLRGFSTTAPEVRFNVRFNQAGTYYVWIRGFAASAGDDSIHSGLDGAVTKAGSAISEFAFGTWSWSTMAEGRTRRATLNVSSTGIHVVNLWMKEDGLLLDKVVLTTNAGFVPSGTGPAESGRESVTPPAILSLSTSTMSFSATANGGVPGNQNLGISFSGAGAAWTAGRNFGWLSLSPASGSGNGTVVVSASTAGLPAGTYNDVITVIAAAAQGSPRTVSVTFNVIANDPTLSLSTGSMSFSATANGGNPGSQNLGVSFSNGAPNWTASKNASWLSLSQTAAAGNSTIVVSALTAGLAAGTYNDTVTVSAPTAQGSPKTVSVTFVVNAAAQQTEFYVSPAGTSGNNGSIGQPWDIVTAMNHPPAVQPGATIWVRAGSYGGHNDILYVKLIGTAAAPIIVRAYPGERATINSPMQVGCCDSTPDPAQGAYVWLWGLEFTSPVELRDAKNNGVDVFAIGSRLINNIFHDTAQGIGFWKSAQNGEAHGNLSYHNGCYCVPRNSPNSPPRGSGHGIYSQNDSGRKKLSDNIVFNQFGWGIHLYGSSASEVRNYDIDGNVSFNNGLISDGGKDNIIMAGGNSGLSGFSVTNNHFYMTLGNQFEGFNEIGWIFSGNNPDAVVTDNHFIGGRDALASFGWKNLTMVRNRILSLTNLVWLDTSINGTGGFSWNNNTYYGVESFRYNGQLRDFGQWKAATGLDSASTHSPSLPTGTWLFTRKNQCEAGRGHVIVYNWDNLSSVSVDLSGILTPGMAYQIRDAQNFYGSPIAQGTYGGGTVSIPMTGLSVVPVHGYVLNAPVHTAPRFGVFVVLQPSTSSKTCS